MGRRVLLVDDDALCARAMVKLLSFDGINCDHVTSVPEALCALGQVPYEAIVTDLHLGKGGSGQDLIERMRGTRLVVLSGDFAALMKLTGVDAVLRKPCAPSALLRAIVGSDALHSTEDGDPP